MSASAGAGPERGETGPFRRWLRSLRAAPSAGGLLSFAVGASVVGLAVLAVCVLAWPRLAGTNVLRSCPQLFCDFTLYYAPMGETVFRTARPVDGFLYSPFVALLLAVFAPLGHSVSLALWGLLQLAAVGLYLLLLRQLAPGNLRRQLLFAALALSSYPVLLNLWAGQFSVFLTAAVLGSLACREQGLRVAGAGLFAGAVSIKFYPLLFAVPFAARRDVRFLALAGIASATALLAIPGLLLGADNVLSFYRTLIERFRDSVWVTANPHSQFFPHVLVRLAGATGQDLRGWLPFLWWVSFGIAAANVALIAAVRRADPRFANLWSFQIIFLTTPFVLKTSWPHDFVFLPFTQAFLLQRSAEAGTAPAVRWLVMMSIGLSNVAFFAAFGHFSAYGYAGFLFWATLLLLVAAYVELLLSARHRAGSRA